MQIPPKLKEEITACLFQEIQSLSQSKKNSNDSTKNSVITCVMSKGIKLGMCRAIDIINNWNKSNKEKTVVKAN